MAAIGLSGLYAFSQYNFAAAAFAGMALFAWAHAYNIRFPGSVEERGNRFIELANQMSNDPGFKMTTKTTSTNPTEKD